MHGSPCPIAIVPRWEASGGLHTIGVAYVDTEEGREALRGADALAKRAGATLRVLTAVKAGPAIYSKTEARTAEQRGKEFDEVEGERRGRAEEDFDARPTRSTATSRWRPTPSSRIPPTS
jgi:hypothetical protein